MNGPPTAVQETIDKTDLSIFPNPFSDLIKIESPIPFHSISCYSLDGTLILVEEVSSSKHTLDLSFIPSGMYMIRVDFDSGIRTMKIMKL